MNPHRLSREKCCAAIGLVWLLILSGSGSQLFGQGLIPFRLPLPTDRSKVRLVDLDGDGDPDLLYTVINGYPVLWIDDDDDMKWTDVEGDTYGDCLLIDRDKDGRYGGPGDLIIKWCDEDRDHKADLQLIVDNGQMDRHTWDWSAHYMWIIGTDKDNIFNYIDWNTLQVKCWEHSGASDFYTDYHGKTLFLKMHASTFNITDLRYNWENPFLFFDPDNDGYTEMTIRLLDQPYQAAAAADSPLVNPSPSQRDYVASDTDRYFTFSRNITHAALSWDLDNDNGPGNEFDLDMSLGFWGKGLSYRDQVHHFNSLRGLPETDTFFYDPRFRHLTELVYPDHDSAYRLIMDKGKWDRCWLVFDEDDDCQRWERVEFYEPGDPFRIGMNNGGLDNNPQADAAGDRGEWDSDFSGKGRLYIGAFDEKIHLLGAEKGAWRVDQAARSFQGWGGLYDGVYKRLQQEPSVFPTVCYEDSDGDGFFDIIKFDLDGDHVFEKVYSLQALHLPDTATSYDIRHWTYSDFSKLFRDCAEASWKKGMAFVELAGLAGLNPDWYSFYMHPVSLQEKYNMGYWLSLYLFLDLNKLAAAEGADGFSGLVDRAYFGNKWKDLADYLKKRPATPGKRPLIPRGRPLIPGRRALIPGSK